MSILIGFVADNINKPSFDLAGNEGSIKLEPLLRAGAAFRPIRWFNAALDVDLNEVDSGVVNVSLPESPSEAAMAAVMFRSTAANRYCAPEAFGQLSTRSRAEAQDREAEHTCRAQPESRDVPGLTVHAARV